ncbi:MAG: choloylglycine hydrolase [Acutalibacteraceae bacterium]|nr:choloylglycine hydrolase [Acutalibacteraceae bacterium]
MCTAISVSADSHYFGRTLDYEHSFEPCICIVPRNYSFNFTDNLTVKSHYAIIGTAKVINDYPLLFDGANEKGLCAAALNFKNNAVYRKNTDKKVNIAQFEFLSFLLSTCKSVKEVREKLINLNITDTPFDEQYPAAPLHFIFADKNDCITIESVSEGLKVYENPVGVLTNNPTFNIQLFSLNNYINLSEGFGKSKVWGSLEAKPYSCGMGALGLPGDFSSTSRFIRAAFLKNHIVWNKDNTEKFFKILDSVSVPEGVCITENGKLQKTYYACLIDAQKGIYAYTTKENRQITQINMTKENLDGERLMLYSFVKNQNIFEQN